MALPTSAIDHYQQQQQIAVATTEQVNALWRSMGDNFDLSWSQLAPEVFTTVLAGQLAAAQSGLAYVPTVLAEQDIKAPSVAVVNPQRLIGGADDGRPLESLLHGAVYNAKSQVASGAGVAEALSLAGGWLEGVVLDSVRFADRQAVAAGMTVRPHTGGWVRMTNPPSCKFCIMLAGKFFRWNQGFQSHDGCDCRHIPSNESVSGDLTVDPYAYFHSLPEREQNQVFGKADAQAIRDGGDMYRVVNIRSRGLADSHMKRTPGHNRGWQARRWDTPSEMTIDDIYAVAKGRNDAIRLMNENGYITGEQVAGGNLKGNSGFGFAGSLGRGGTRKGATIAYQKAVTTGQRDLLEPATQTAAERRLHTAYLVKQASDQGRNPFGSTRLTKADKDLADEMYRREVAKLHGDPERGITPAADTVIQLAKLLHIL